MLRRKNDLNQLVLPYCVITPYLVESTRIRSVISLFSNEKHILRCICVCINQLNLLMLAKSLYSLDSSFIIYILCFCFQSSILYIRANLCKAEEGSYLLILQRTLHFRYQLSNIIEKGKKLSRKQ